MYNLNACNLIMYNLNACNLIMYDLNACNLIMYSLGKEHRSRIVHLSQNRRVLGSNSTDALCQLSGKSDLPVGLQNAK